jgi:hypothetical protein
VSVRISTVEEPGRDASVSGPLSSFILDGGEDLEKDRIHEGAEPERREVALVEMQDIALSELARRRRRLGNLTIEQELAVETLLISTVSRISEIVAAMKLSESAGTSPP